ncbi:MAG: hypothetical protein QOC99_1591 [Acidobacteriota bacterium]|jgi:hypothetical protein|nr:hypothetical protein [Acidobacteriota bacterium]
MTKDNINTEITNTISAKNATPDKATYEFVITTFRGLGTCVKHKYIEMTFEDELDTETLLMCIDLALERGDLVKPTMGCISAPEFAEKSHTDFTAGGEDKQLVGYKQHLNTTEGGRSNETF